MPEEVRVRITGDAADLESAVGDATGAMGGLGKASSLLSPAMLGVAGVAVAAGAAIVKMTMAAAADRDEQARLEAAIKASGAATGDWSAEMQAAITAGQELAFTDSDVRAAMIPLVQTTGDVTSATALLSTAQDVARLAGVDLETAANAVAKASEGQGGALTRLVPALAGVEEGTDLVAEAQRLASGQADTFAASTEGQLAKSSNAFDELQETIGAVFLPVLDEIVPILIPILETLGELIQAVLPVLIPLVKAVAEHFKTFVSIIRMVIRFVGQLLDGIQNLLKPLQDLLGGLGGLLDFKMPSFDFPDLNPFDASAPQAAHAGRAGWARGGITINTGADPQSVVRHVRAWVRANGAL